MPNKRDKNKRIFGAFFDKDFLEKFKKFLESKAISQKEFIEQAMYQAMSEELESIKQKGKKNERK